MHLITYRYSSIIDTMPSFRDTTSPSSTPQIPPQTTSTLFAAKTLSDHIPYSPSSSSGAIGGYDDRYGKIGNTKRSYSQTRINTPSSPSATSSTHPGHIISPSSSKIIRPSQSASIVSAENGGIFVSRFLPPSRQASIDSSYNFNDDILRHTNDEIFGNHARDQRASNFASALSGDGSYGPDLSYVTLRRRQPNKRNSSYINKEEQLNNEIATKSNNTALSYPSIERQMSNPMFPLTRQYSGTASSSSIVDDFIDRGKNSKHGPPYCAETPSESLGRKQPTPSSTDNQQQQLLGGVIRRTPSKTNSSYSSICSSSSTLAENEDETSRIGKN